MAMTKKQMRFCQEYLISLNATDAAVKAGYAKKSARSIGQENLTKPDIQKYIDEKLQEIEDSKIMDAKEVMERLTAIGRREVKENQVVTLREKKELWVPTGEDGTLKKQVIENEHAEVVEMPAKLSDVNKALELMGKRHALFTDKVDLQSGDIVIKVGEWNAEDEAT
ncbi:MAG: terminase small subunit [Streptococcaceae bacterium]|jgi:phage terminase small subunit|nr:terminase small subunit [Streptococcaceae bacterium]MCH4176202.1 terminase small subunit [Streptococcaceae bacterium]